SISLLKNQRLELRQCPHHQWLLNADCRNRSVCSVPIHRSPVQAFSQLNFALSLKQPAKKRYRFVILTGHRFCEFPQQRRHAQRNRKMARGTRLRGRLGSGNAVQMVGRTEGLGASAEVVDAGRISEPINATNCHQATVCPVVERITHPARGRRSARQLRCAKDKRAAKCSPKKSTAKRGGGG